MMRRTACTLLFALFGWVLLEPLHAQEANVFKEEDVRSLKALQDKMSNAVKDLSMEARKLPTQSKAQVCLGVLSKQLSRVLDEMLPLSTLVFISSRMQLKADEVVVNRQVKTAIAFASGHLPLCPRIARDVMELDCPLDENVKRRVLELTQICSEASALLHRFEARVERQLKKAQ